MPSCGCAYDASVDGIQAQQAALEYYLVVVPVSVPAGGVAVVVVVLVLVVVVAPGVAVPVSVPVAVLVVVGVVAPVSVPVAVPVEVVVPPSGVVGPQAVSAAASTTLVAARAIVCKLRAIKLVRLLLSCYAYPGYEILFGLDHLHIDKLVIVANLKRPQ